MGEGGDPEAPRSLFKLKRPPRVSGLCPSMLRTPELLMQGGGGVPSQQHIV